jgi:hypothetical protein
VLINEKGIQTFLVDCCAGEHSPHLLLYNIDIVVQQVGYGDVSVEITRIQTNKRC